MKKYTLPLLFVLCAYITFAQSTKQAVLKVLDLQSAAWNRGDIPGFMEGYWRSDSLMFIGKTAPTYGWQTTLDHYKKSYPDKAAMGTLTFSIIKVNVMDANNAFVLGGWHLKREKDEPGGYFTLWFKKIKEKWVIVCDHTS